LKNEEMPYLTILSKVNDLVGIEVTATLTGLALAAGTFLQRSVNEQPEIQRSQNNFFKI